MLAHFILDMMLLVRHAWQMMSLLASSLTMVVLLRFGLPASLSETVILPAFLLGALVISLINVTQQAFMEDAYAGRIPHWHTGRLSVEWVVASRFLSYLLCYGVPMVALFCAVMLAGLAEWNEAMMWHHAVVLLLTSSTVIACGLLSGALSVCFRASSMMAYLLIVPFIFSVVIFAAPALRDVSASEMTLLTALTFISVPLACFATARVLKLYTH
jgi:heme exporter protein CcmB